jgi:hypothetical protein
VSVCLSLSWDWIVFSKFEFDNKPDIRSFIYSQPGGPAGGGGVRFTREL